MMRLLWTICVRYGSPEWLSEPIEPQEYDLILREKREREAMLGFHEWQCRRNPGGAN